LDLDVKNLKGDTVLEIARTKAKRAAIDNKKSSFRVNKKPVDDRKIDRFLQRNEISRTSYWRWLVLSMVILQMLAVTPMDADTS
jgi:hypothetical protein